MGKKMKYCSLVRDTAYIATFPLSSTIPKKKKEAEEDAKRTEAKTKKKKRHKKFISSQNQWIIVIQVNEDIS